MSQNATDFLRDGTVCLSKGGLKIGDGAKTGIATAAPNGAGIDYAIGGILYHKAESATNVPLTADTVQAALTKCLYLVQIDSGGTISTKKGTEVLTADLTAGNKVLHWPVPDANKC